MCGERGAQKWERGGTHRGDGGKRSCSTSRRDRTWFIVRLRVRTAWSERLCSCERCSLSSTIAEDVCITMPPPIFRGAVPGDVMHLLDPHVTIGELRHLNANHDVFQLIAQCVWSVE